MFHYKEFDNEFIVYLIHLNTFSVTYIITYQLLILAVI